MKYGVGMEKRENSRPPGRTITVDDDTQPLIGDSPLIQQLRAQLARFADLPYPVLIVGESGSGKDIVATTYLHQNTQRRNRPFFALNCAAIAPTLVEATLFGHAKGAFTGALTPSAGYFEEAAEGTLFLDEVGELSPDLQAKLLRVLENGEYQRVGETRRRISHARIIAATNRDLHEEMRQGKFRIDLYHRLSVFSISMPPLRELAGDKLLLLDHFRQIYKTHAHQAAFSLSIEARALWLRYDFPGNVRELRNVVIRLSAKYPGETISVDTLAGEFRLEVAITEDSTGRSSRETDNASFFDTAIQRLRRREPFSLDHALDETERSYIGAAMRLTNGNVARAARLLGIKRTTLHNRIESHSMRR